MSDYDYKQSKHNKVRAVGKLYIQRPGTGYDNRVMEATVQEMEFNNSKEAEKYMNHMRKKILDRRGLINQRRMKLASISSD
jgi:hypothetical protein